MTVYNTPPWYKMLSEPVSSETSAARITTVASLGGCRPDLSIDGVARRLHSTGRREIGMHMIRNWSKGG